ncbi:hypothetical protein N7491_011377 [Penicillium cf. griseofulvum]|nr:hypothetical protein N7491_011377 [Penicillium cf. griseofulvum]
MSKKPATLAEIRETVSFLTETHEYDSFHEDAAIDEEGGQDEQMTEAGTPAAEEPKGRLCPSHPQPQPPAAHEVPSSTASGPPPTSLLQLRPIVLRKHPLRLPCRRRQRRSCSLSSGSSDSRKTMKASAGASTAKKGAVNYYTAAREKERERAVRAKERSSGSNVAALLNKHASNRRGLGALGKGQWE